MALNANELLLPTPNARNGNNLLAWPGGEETFYLRIGWHSPPPTQAGQGNLAAYPFLTASATMWADRVSGNMPPDLLLSRRVMGASLNGQRRFTIPWIMRADHQSYTVLQSNLGLAGEMIRPVAKWALDVVVGPTLEASLEAHLNGLLYSWDDAPSRNFTFTDPKIPLTSAVSYPYWINPTFLHREMGRPIAEDPPIFLGMSNSDRRQHAADVYLVPGGFRCAR